MIVASSNTSGADMISARYLKETADEVDIALVLIF